MDEDDKDLDKLMLLMAWHARCTQLALTNGVPAHTEGHLASVNADLFREGWASGKDK